MFCECNHPGLGAYPKRSQHSRKSLEEAMWVHPEHTLPALLLGAAGGQQPWKAVGWSRGQDRTVGVAEAAPLVARELQGEAQQGNTS